jgi:hypothetical protein
MSNALPSTGWYPDPEQPGSERWWDGNEWTEYRRASSAAGVPAGPDQQRHLSLVPPLAQPAYQPQTTSGMAIASLVLGIASLPFFAFVIPAVLAVVFSLVGMSAVKRGRGVVKGKGLAICGLVLGILSLVGFALFFGIAVLVGYNSAVNARQTRDETLMITNAAQRCLAASSTADCTAGATLRKYGLDATGASMFARGCDHPGGACVNVTDDGFDAQATSDGYDARHSITYRFHSSRSGTNARTCSTSDPVLRDDYCPNGTW